MYSKVLGCLSLFFLSSCTSTRSLVYFNDVQNEKGFSEEIKNRVEPIIQPNDLLEITVISLNPESNILFNSGILQTIGSPGNAGASGKVNEGYLVAANGTINFPVLGNVKLAGLTKEEATGKMTAEIKTHVKNPIVNIRFMNFRITVLGEVNRPSTFVVPSERINLVEALGQAGDMTAFGKRDNVLILREKNGIRSINRINMASKDALNSPYFYLQQNDVVYVEPVKVKGLQTSSSSFYLPLISVAVTIISLIVVFFR
jgi:polysaccharide export outer membrane protein